MSNENCRRCGKCCANILLLSKKEIQDIKEYIKTYNIRLINRNSVFLKEDVNICPFLSLDKSQCNIYPVRPSICKSFNCNPKLAKTMNYDGVEAVNMLLTFGNGKQFSSKAPDLTFINNRVKELQQKINKGE